MIRGRYAPTPSGRMHLGNVFCALLSWLAVKSQGGEMVLRIEDLDRSRCRQEYTDILLEDLQYLGLVFDEGPREGGENSPYFQSLRTELYVEVLKLLEDKGVIYPCYCSRDELHAANAPHASDGRIVYPGTCRSLTRSERASKTRPPAYRFRSNAEDVVFSDLHYGTQRVNVKTEWGDFIVRRSDGIFAYQLAVVADDISMGINQITRGNDLLMATAPQLQLYDMLKVSRPMYCHIPMLVAPDGRRLSKRDKDMDLGVLRSYYSYAEPLIGYLLYRCGILDHPEALSAKEALSVFSIDRLVKCNIPIVSEEVISL